MECALAPGLAIKSTAVQFSAVRVVPSDAASNPRADHDHVEVIPSLFMEQLVFDVRGLEAVAALLAVMRLHRALHLLQAGDLARAGGGPAICDRWASRSGTCFRISLPRSRHRELIEREDPLPVLLHADDVPAALLRLFHERLRKGSDLRVRQDGRGSVAARAVLAALAAVGRLQPSAPGADSRQAQMIGSPALFIPPEVRTSGALDNTGQSLS
jgi:hypothetical protein